MSLNIASYSAVVLARVVSAHGIRGDVKVKSFTSPSSQLFEYQDVVLDGNSIQFSKKSEEAGGYFIISCVGIDDRNKAIALVGKEFTVERKALAPLPADECYLFEVIGCKVIDYLGKNLGQISRVDHFGASDVMTIVGENGNELLLPLSRDFIAVWDLANKQLILKEFETL